MNSKKITIENKMKIRILIAIAIVGRITSKIKALVKIAISKQAIKILKYKNW